MGITESLLIATFILLMVLTVIHTFRGFKIKDLKIQRKELYKALDKKDREKEERDRKIFILENRVAELEKGDYDMLEAMRMDTSTSAPVCIENILKRYTVSNKNKIILIKMLFMFLIANQSRFSLDNISTNKNTLTENAKYLKKFYIDGETVSKEVLPDIGSAILTLIFYSKK